MAFGATPPPAVAHAPALCDPLHDAVCSHPQARARQLAAGERLFAAHASAEAVCIVLHGVLRLERISSDGGRCIVRLLGPGDWLGLEALPRRLHGADAVACTAARVLRLPGHALAALLPQQPDGLRALLTHWQQALDDAQDWSPDLLRGAAYPRFLRLLLRLAALADARGLSWLPARQELGDMLGTSLETASRLVSRSRRERLVETVGTAWMRVDVPGVRRVLRNG